MTKTIDNTSGSGIRQAANCWRLKEYFGEWLSCAFSAPCGCTSGNFLRKDAELDRPLIWPTLLFWSALVQITQRTRIDERTKLGRSACRAQLCFNGTNPIKNVTFDVCNASECLLKSEQLPFWEALTTQILSVSFPHWYTYDSLSYQSVYCTILVYFISSCLMQGFRSVENSSVNK